MLSRSYYVTQLARKVVQIYDNDCNGDMHRNGETRVQRLVASMSDEQSVFFDVGSNVGEWSEALLSAGAKGRLIAVDPIRRNLQAVQKRLDRFGWSRYELCELALSDTPGKARFFTHTDVALSGHDSLLDMHSIGYAESVESTEVTTETLDSLAARLAVSGILFLKIDVEGNELSVLKGANGLLSTQAIEFIQIEFGHASRAARIYLHDIVNYVSCYGYSMFVIKPNGLLPLDFTPFTENRYAFINFLIVRKSSVDRIGGELLRR